MTKGLGAVCLVIGGTLLGLRYQREQKDALLALREAILFLEELRTEISERHTLMPVLLERLCRRERLFAVPTERDCTADFEAQWRAVVLATVLEGECQNALLGMGEALARGADCDKTVDLAMAALHRCEERHERELERQGRVPAVVGLCSGALLAVLLL